MMTKEDGESNGKSKKVVLYRKHRSRSWRATLNFSDGTTADVATKMTDKKRAYQLGMSQYVARARAKGLMPTLKEAIAKNRLARGLSHGATNGVRSPASTRNGTPRGKLRKGHALASMLKNSTELPRLRALVAVSKAIEEIAPMDVAWVFEAAMVLRRPVD